MKSEKVISLILSVAGCVSVTEAQPADSLRIDSLCEVTVVAAAPIRSVAQKEDGSAVLTRRGLSETPSFMGSNDPMAILKTLPAIATSNDLHASMNVKGSPSGSNAYYADGMRITNPLHMLGFYSAFNPDFFHHYNFRSGYVSATAPITTAALFEASSGNDVASRTSAAVSVGMIESHLAVETPVLKNRLSVAAGSRMAYPSKIFPDLLQLGSSSMKYGFWDANLAICGRLTPNDIIKISFFADRDNTDVTDRHQGAKDGVFRWSNYAAGIVWSHGDNDFNVSWSQYRNKLYLDEGGRILDLPSGLDQLSASANLKLLYGFGVRLDANRLRTLGQHNATLQKRNGVAARESFDVNAGLAWNHRFGKLFELDPSIKLSVYTTSGYTVFMPQPRLLATLHLGDKHFISASYQRQVRFDRLVETSSGGLPSDFWTAASSVVPPDDVHSFELSGGGRIPWLGGSFRIDFYARRIMHATDYTGSIMDMLSPSFDAMLRIVYGRGWSRGCSISLMRQFGRVRWRIGYNLGKSTLKAAEFGEKAYPANFDRQHDLNANLTWQAFDWLHLTASWVYASGVPYTRAKYGYMIGENLICEYFPHNSSRLPDYKRLDLAASWQHTSRGGLTQKVTVSVYNAVRSRNVLFRYLKYSVSEGISHESSVMNMVIPSLTYTISF